MGNTTCVLRLSYEAGGDRASVFTLVCITNARPLIYSVSPDVPSVYYLALSNDHGNYSC